MTALYLGKKMDGIKISGFTSFSGIYAIICKVNGRIYVGQSQKISRRITEHAKSLEHGKGINSELQYDFNEYGHNGFQVQILERCGRRDLDEREQYHIQRLAASGVKVYNCIPPYLCAFPEQDRQETKRNLINLSRQHMRQKAEAAGPDSILWQYVKDEL